MPKISYLDKDNALFDDTEVTQEHIENKMAEIEALLRGMIDADNLLSHREDTVKINIPPALVVDLASETKPVMQSIKGVDSPTIKARMFTPLVTRIETNPAFAILNSQAGKTIVMSSSSEVDPEGDRFKIISVEIPANYSPVTWGDLYDYIKDVNLNIGIGLSSLNFEIMDVADKDEFLETMGVNANDLCEEVSYETNNVDDSVYTGCVLNLNHNEFTARVDVDSDENDWLLKISPALLCRINP